MEQAAALTWFLADMGLCGTGGELIREAQREQESVSTAVHWKGLRCHTEGRGVQGGRRENREG